MVDDLRDVSRYVVRPSPCCFLMRELVRHFMQRVAADKTASDRYRGLIVQRNPAQLPTRPARERRVRYSYLPCIYLSKLRPSKWSTPFPQSLRGEEASMIRKFHCVFEMMFLGASKGCKTCRNSKIKASSSSTSYNFFLG